MGFIKLKRIYCIIILISSVFTGCLRTYYPAIYQTSSSPLFFESADSIRQLHKFCSADITLSKGDYKAESAQLIKANYTVVETRNHYNINYKLFGYGGNYKVTGMGRYDGNKSVFGLGAEFSTCFNAKINSFKMGLGFNAGLFTEFGGYYNFRNRAKEEGAIESEGRLISFTFSAFPIMSYEFSKSVILSAQANAGIPGFLSPSIVFNNNGYVYWLSWVPDYEDRDNVFGQRIVFGFSINLNNL